MKLVNKQEKNPAVIQFKQTATPIGEVALDSTTCAIDTTFVSEEMVVHAEC
jgi:hypothetical protein